MFTLRSADAPYRALVERMQEGAVTVSADGDVIYSNQYFAALVDAPLQQVIGATIDRHVILPISRLRGHARRRNGTLRTRLRQGRTPVDVSISVSTVAMDDVEHRTLIVTDLRTLTKMQRESNPRTSSSRCWHTSCAIPWAIGGAVQVLGLTELREARAERARDVIQRQVVNMARLVDDLLDVGRVVTGKIVLDRQSIDLADAVRSGVAATISNQIGDRTVEIAAESVWVEAGPRASGTDCLQSGFQCTQVHSS